MALALEFLPFLPPVISFQTSLDEYDGCIVNVILPQSLKCVDADGTAQLVWFRNDVDSDELMHVFVGFPLESKIKLEIMPEK